jgi:hypothetical protein
MTMTDTYRDMAPEQIPASLDDARRELAELLDSLRGIDAQLGQTFMMIPGENRRMTMKEYSDWRRRAADAKRHTERRYRFVKQWIHEQVAQPDLRAFRADGQSSISGELRGMAKRIGGIEAIALAAVVYVRVPSDDNLAGLVEQVKHHAEKVVV